MTMMLKSLKQKIAKVGIGLFCAGCVFLSSAAYSQADLTPLMHLNWIRLITLPLCMQKQHPMITSQMR